MPVLPAAAFGSAAGASSTNPFGSAAGASSANPFDAGPVAAGVGFGGLGSSSSSSVVGGAAVALGGTAAPDRPRPVERLVRDRLGDFQQIAREKGALLAFSTSGTSDKLSPDGKKAANQGFMREFFEGINEIQGILNQGRANVKAMAEVLEEALMATTQDRQQEVSDRLQNLVQDTNGHIAAVKVRLEWLKTRSDEEATKRPNSAEAKIRKNMQQAMAKKHQQLLLDFQQAQVDYKKALERRQHKEMEILMPDATEQERSEMIELGETTSLVVAKKMAGAHALLLDEVQRIREKHQDILKLEASIADLAQMFQEMAVLVESQGEMLDAIELNVHKTKGYTAKAEVQLVKTRKEQHKYQRWMCCLSIVLVIVVIVILGPVLLKYGG